MSRKISEFNSYSDKITFLTKEYSTDLWYKSLSDNTDSFWVYLSQFFFSKVENNKLSQDDINAAILWINNIIKDLLSLKINILNDKDLSSILKNILVNRIRSNILKFVMYRYCIYVEASKAWYPISKELLTHSNFIIDKIQTLIYGPKISDVEEEKQAVLISLWRLFSRKRSLLSIEDQEFFEKDFLLKLWYTGLLSWSVPDWKKEKKVVKNEISSDRLIEIFKLSLSFYGLALKPKDPNGWSVEYTETKNNISVNYSKKLISVPKTKPTYNIKDVFSLIDHEISVHVLRWENTLNKIKKNIWNYLEREEWFAIFSDRIIHNDSWEPGIWHISTFIWENYWYSDSFRLLQIYFKLLWKTQEESTTLAKTRLIRIKKFYGDFPWSYRKNVSYHRWFSFFVEYLSKLSEEEYKKFIDDFYFWKLWDEEFKYVDDLKEILWLESTNILKPCWIWRILDEKFFGWTGSLKALEKRDFRFKAVDRITMEQKRKLISILNIVKSKN